MQQCRLAQEGLSLLPPPLFHHDPGAGETAQDRVRFRRGHTPKAVERLLAVVVVHQQEAEPLQCLGVVRVERNRPLQCGDRLGIPAQLLQRPAGIVMVLGNIGCQADRPHEAGQ